jgi:cytochrome c553
LQLLPAEKRMPAPWSAVGLAVVFCAAAIWTSGQTTGGAAQRTAAERGSTLYQQYCATCHGKDGTGTDHGSDITRLRIKHGAFFRAQIAFAVKGADPIVAHRAPGMMLGGARFRAGARGSESTVEARIDDLAAFLDTIQQR